jgi:hypothetical protein
VQAELIEGDSEENYSSVENANFYVDEDSTVKIRVFTQTYYGIDFSLTEESHKILENKITLE